jgi:hypothetical protein
MSQDWVSNLYTTSTEADTTLSNMELMFATLKSVFSGATAPANQVAGQLWFDTTKKVLKNRNQGDTAWIGLMHGDTSQKIWVYRNSAMDGWAVDSSVSDKVLALKGGTTYTAGAATAGSWTISGLSDTGHTHGAGTYAGPNHAHTGTTDACASTVTPTGPDGYTVAHPSHTHTFTTANAGTGSVTGTSASATATVTTDGAWRPAAAVGTLQYLDL